MQFFPLKKKTQHQHPQIFRVTRQSQIPFLTVASTRPLAHLYNKWILRRLCRLRLRMMPKTRRRALLWDPFWPPPPPVVMNHRQHRDNYAIKPLHPSCYLREREPEPEPSSASEVDVSGRHLYIYIYVSPKTQSRRPDGRRCRLRTNCKCRHFIENSATQ